MAKIYELKGKINSINGAEFAKDLLAFAEKNGEVRLDARKLTYISSSGIRGLMKLYNKQRKLIIDNVSKEIFNVFYSAGLTELFNINTELDELVNDGWDILGVGASGTVYKIDEDTAIKVYGKGIDFDYVSRERELARKAIICGVPTILPFKNVKVDNSFATIIELINSKSLGELLQSEPDRFDELMDRYVEMIKNIHSIEDNRNYFVNLQDIWLKYDYMIKEGLSSDNADLVLDIYRNSKRSNNLLHGDIHPGNVMMSEGEMVLVDMATMSTGPDILDVISIYRLSMYGKDLGLLETAEKSMGFKSSMFEKFWDAFARRYYETDDKETLQKISEQLYNITAFDLMFSINTIPPEYVRNYFRKYGESIMRDVIIPNQDQIRKIFAEGKLDI